MSGAAVSFPRTYRQSAGYRSMRATSIPSKSTTFYRLPSKETCEAWYRQTPAKFRFVVKASRYITHIKRLREARKSWMIF